jgi:hypothetical protein
LGKGRRQEAEGRREEVIPNLNAQQLSIYPLVLKLNDS